MTNPSGRITVGGLFNGEVEIMVQFATVAIEPCRRAQKVEATQPRSAIAVVSVDLSGSITGANALALQVLGYSQEQITGSHFDRFLILSHLNTDPVSDAYSDDPIATCVAKGRAVHSIYGLLRRADRRGLEPVEVSIAPVDDEGVVAGAVLIIDGADLSPS